MACLILCKKRFVFEELIPLEPMPVAVVEGLFLSKESFYLEKKLL
jgi:hypothetical protein